MSALYIMIFTTDSNRPTYNCRSDALDPYRKFVAFYTRSENPFVNYYSVLDAGMAWETSQFGNLSRDESVSLFTASITSILNVIKGSIQRTTNCCTFIADFAVEFCNLQGIFISYNIHLKSLRPCKDKYNFVYCLFFTSI